MSLDRAIQLAGPIPADDERQAVKKAYSELLSRELAFEMAAVLRTRPIFAKASPRRPKSDAAEQPPVKRLKLIKRESPEKYFLGGFGRKKLDVSIADEQDGLLLAVSIKTITTRDNRTHNYNKNFKNRFGDLCAEATSVHMRSPYTVMCGLFAMPASAAFDATSRRNATAQRAIKYLRSISGRISHEQSPEKFESLAFVLFDPVLQDETTREYLVAEVRIPGIRPHSEAAHGYRVYDVWDQVELTIEEYADKIRRIFLARDPFLEE